MPPEEQVKLEFLYVLIEDGGSEQTVIQEGQLAEYAEQVANDEVAILRFLAFSDTAKGIAGKPGRVEKMLAEESSSGAPDDAVEGEEEESDDVEADTVDEEPQFTTSWETIPGQR